MVILQTLDFFINVNIFRFLLKPIIEQRIMDIFLNATFFTMGIIISFVIVWIRDWQKENGERQKSAKLVYKEIESQVDSMKRTIDQLANLPHAEELWR